MATKLNNSMRQAFVSAVMDDVPSIDYAEIIRVKIQEWHHQQLPEKIRALLGTPEEKYLFMNYYHYQHGVSCAVYGETFKLSDTLREELSELSSLCSAQWEARRAMELKLDGVIRGCSTIEQAEKMLPEFVKYLPKPDAPNTKGVPVIANVVAELSTMGWPKGEKRAGS